MRGNTNSKTDLTKELASLVRTLHDAKKQPEALRRLSDLCVPHETLTQASAAGLAALVEATADRKVPNRVDLLEVALHIVEGERLPALVAYGMDVEQREVALRFSTGPGAAVREMLGASGRQLLALSDDRDPGVRLGAARLLAYTGAPQLLTELLTRLDKEANAVVRAWMLIAAGHLARPDGGGSRWAEVLARPKDEPLPRGIANIVEAVVTKRAAAVRAEWVVGALRACTERWPATSVAPWRLGWIDDTLLTLLGDGPLGIEGRTLATESAIAVGSELRVHPRLSRWSHEILRWNFAVGKKDFDTLYEAPTELTPWQRTVVGGLASFETQRTGNEYTRYGLPPDARSRRRWAGLVPPSVLERAFSGNKLAKGQTWPLWRLAARALKASKPLTKALASELATLTPRELLDFWTEIAAGAYGLSDPSARDVVLELTSTMPVVAVREWAEAWRGDLTSCADRQASESIGWLIVRAVTARLGKSDPVPEAFDALLSLFGPPAQLQAIFQRLPSARAVAILERAIAGSSMGAYNARERIRDHLLPVLPEAKKLVDKP